MSWESYITGPSGLLNRGPIEKAGIFGVNGAVWAESGIGPDYQELLAIAGLFVDPSPGYANGFALGGQKFTLIRIDEEMLHGKAKGGGSPNCITIQKTTQALVTAIGKADAPAGQVSMAVGAIGDYLSKAGY
jgi:hypothetical protein